MDYYSKYNKYKQKYLKLKNQIGGHYTDPIKDKADYLDFLNNMEALIKLMVDYQKEADTSLGNSAYHKLESEPKFLFNHEKLMCIHIKTFIASNYVYQIEIDRDTKIFTDTIYIDGNITKFALKYCDMDKTSCTFSACKELDAIVKLSKLVVNKICNSYMLFFGFLNCGCIDFTNDETINIKLDEDIVGDEFKHYDRSVIITNFIENSKHISKDGKLDDRQLFEYLYSIICCLANYGLDIADRHADNYLSYPDTSGIIYKIHDKQFYFPSLNALCFIDYQANSPAIKDYNDKFNITNQCTFIRDYCDADSLIKLDSQIKIGTIDELLDSLITNFEEYNSEEVVPCDIKTFTYAVLSQ
jgi:hypothetical protein